jgi:hypothetical protein
MNKTQFWKKMISAAILCLALIWTPAGALAIPLLPASFYGVVRVNNANLPDGTLIEALINGVVYASTQTMTFEGNSVFTLDIPGDDPVTPVVDGGVDGDTIPFRVSGILADQTAVWRSSTNVELNLAVSSSIPVLSPQPPEILQKTDSFSERGTTEPLTQNQTVTSYISPVPDLADQGASSTTHMQTAHQGQVDSPAGAPQASPQEDILPDLTAQDDNQVSDPQHSGSGYWIFLPIALLFIFLILARKFNLFNKRSDED